MGNFTKFWAAPLALGFAAVPAFAGPVVIDGTDANDHGSASGSPPANQQGWRYMEAVLRAMAPAVGNNNRVVVDLGTTTGQARNAIVSAFNLSSLPSNGWSLVHIDGEANIGSFLDGGTVNGQSLSTAGIIYLPTAGNSSGDLTTQELSAINQGSRPVAINNFIGGNGDPSRGGGLFAMAESGTGAWGWLNSLVPGINAVDAGSSGSTTSTPITLTPEGQAAFPGLSNSDLSAGPWHGYFEGNLGGLEVLATAPHTVSGQTFTRNIIIGGNLQTISNRGPVVDDDTITVTVGDTGTHTFTATDPDGDPLIWAFVDFTGPAAPAVQPVFDPATQVFTWDTTGSELGAYSARVRATDPSGLTDIGTLTINVVPEPSTGALLLLGVGGALASRRRRS